MSLTKEALEQRLQETEVRFNAAKIAKDQAEAELEARSNECLRIQGEFRALKALVKGYPISMEADLGKTLPVEDAPEVKVENEPPEVKVENEPKQEATNGRAK